MVSEFLVKNNNVFTEKVKPLRDALQAQFLQIIYTGLETKPVEQLLADCKQCFELEQEYLREISAYLTT